MTAEKSSYRQILRSSSIIGGASVINILAGVVRMKVAAVLLGPTGVGMIGLLQSLMATASAVAGLGLGASGTRQIAEAAGKDDDDEVADVRKALFWGASTLALLGGLAFWFSRDLIANRVLSDPQASSNLAWLSLGVALSVASGSQTAFLNGLRRIGDLARLSVASSLLSTLIGITALIWFGMAGMLVFILAAPLANFLLGHWFVRRVKTYRPPNSSFVHIRSHLGSMFRLGAPFMLSGLATSGGFLVVRALVQSELGAEALGLYQAAWQIGAIYIGFVLSAMGSDYYPRLTASIGNHESAIRLINEQTEVALLLAGPVVIAMMGLAPWLMGLLYSDAFVEGAGVLRWMLLGDLLKVAAFPVGFVILAKGHGGIFLASETLSISVLVLFIWLGLPIIGLQASGVGYLIMYGVCLPVVYWLAKRSIGFFWSKSVWRYFFLYLFLATFLFALSYWSEFYGAMLAVLMSVLLGCYSTYQISAVRNSEAVKKAY